MKTILAGLLLTISVASGAVLPESDLSRKTSRPEEKIIRVASQEDIDWTDWIYYFKDWFPPGYFPEEMRLGVAGQKQKLPIAYPMRPLIAKFVKLQKTYGQLSDEEPEARTEEASPEFRSSEERSSESEYSDSDESEEDSPEMWEEFHYGLQQLYSFLQDLVNHY